MATTTSTTTGRKAKTRNVNKTTGLRGRAARSRNAGADLNILDGVQMTIDNQFLRILLPIARVPSYFANGPSWFVNALKGMGVPSKVH